MHVCTQSLSHVWHFATPGTIDCQAPLSMGLSWQEYWSGLLFPPPGNLTDVGIEQESPVSPGLAGIRGQRSTSKLFISDWSVQRMLNFALHTRMLPSTTGDVIWRSLQCVSSSTQRNPKWPIRKVKGKTPCLPFHSDGFCLPGPKVQFTSKQQGPNSSLSVPTTAHRVSSNFDDEQWRAPSGSDPSLRAFVFSCGLGVRGSPVISLNGSKN